MDRDLVDEVRRQRDAVRGGESADAQRLRKTVGAADVRHGVLDRLAVEELLEFPARVVILAAGDRNADRTRDFGVAVVVVGEHWLLVPQEVELFEQSRLALVGEDVAILVHVDHHAHARTERLLHRRDAARVHGGVRMVDLHLVVLAAQARIFLRFGHHLVNAVLRPATRAVRGHAIGHRAPQLVERQLGALAGDVPEPDVERGERVSGHALLADAHVDAEHLFPQALDKERIFADERRLQARVEIGEHRFGAAAVEHQAVAESPHALVGEELGDDELVLGVLQRHRLGRGDAEKAGVNRGDLHGPGMVLREGGWPDVCCIRDAFS